MRKTKIICTIGPAVESEETLRELMLSGMDCARLNFSHGDHDEHLIRINRIKALREELHLPIPILLDTKGPEIRIGTFENGSVEIEKGQTFTFDSSFDGLGNNEIVSISYPICTNVDIGTTILVDDGKLSFVVVEISESKVITNALNSGTISNRKSVNIPNVALDIPYLSAKDRSDILFGIENQIDFIAASFVRDAKDVLELREFLDNNGGSFIKIISKIENKQGIDNLDEIIKISDGIMIARGDMGVEVPFKDLPAIQKDIIKKCYRAGKYVITATQMLDSMTNNPRPTRAEVSDVANAIYDGTTIIMLSGETAMGKYPIRSVKTMAEIAESTENDINYIKKFDKNHLDLGPKVMSAIANAACISAHQLNAKAIIAVTRKGVTAQSISNYRPLTPIIAVTPNECVYRQLNLSWNVLPILDENQFTTDDEFDFESAIKKAIDNNQLNKDDMVIMAAGVKKSDLQTGILKILKV
ncbi:MAG TPA: pyruvate kinase [Acholeplasmataceae bacterium]|jgi:pyruvate kinase|nr:pyruvate kinase [Acholeplasmataceae bacterium]